MFQLWLSPYSYESLQLLVTPAKGNFSHQVNSSCVHEVDLEKAV